MSVSSFKKLEPEEYLRQHYQQGLRPDGRKGLTSLRPVSISVGSISVADGSAVVKQGDTIVVCGIKLEIAKPRAGNPKQGFIVPNLTLAPICHPQFRPGPPSEEAQTASQFLHESIVNSGIIKLEDLCICEDKYVWCIYADLTCLNYGGNILDTALKALVAALSNTTVPKVNVVEQENEDPIVKVDLKENRKPLQLGAVPISCTVSVFDDKLLLDPTDEEEECSEACVTVVLCKSATTENELCHVHKPGGSAISPDKLHQCIALAKKNSKTIQRLIDTASSSTIK